MTRQEEIAGLLDQHADNGQNDFMAPVLKDAAQIIRAYDRLEKQFDAMSEIAEQAMVIARLANKK